MTDDRNEAARRQTLAAHKKATKALTLLREAQEHLASTQDRKAMETAAVATHAAHRLQIQTAWSLR